MRSIEVAISEFIAADSLPTEASFFEEVGLYDQKENQFPVQEGTYWDYKDAFPYSLSDEYFGGILRLICAFHNTFGGMLIFGVHDKKRDPGHNKVKINIDTFQNALRQKLNNPIRVIHKEYNLKSGDEKTKIDVLLVPKRPAGVPPSKFSERIGQYGSGIIWLRQNSEVVRAKSADLPFLYSGRTDLKVDSRESDESIPSAIPPSPATVREFVGRTVVLDSLYDWLFNDDEPRKFLWGKGGSGKSTIAHQFARLISEFGGQIKSRANRAFDYVLFVSAKKEKLEPISRRIQRDSGCDFEDVNSLFRSVLALSGWMDIDEIEKLEPANLRAELVMLFDSFQVFLVIDDIDTLTTAGIDAGIDELYRIIVRSKLGNKVLYTLRNAPSHSLVNSLEVPGLSKDQEFPEFLSACCTQFKVPVPETAIRREEIATITERRPLAIEVVIGFTRTCSFDDAIRLYQGKEGEEARKYLFKREYAALPHDNRARHFLAALHLFGRPVRLLELEHVLQFSKEQINDCVSQTLEMFLVQERSENGEIQVSLGSVTRAFIAEVSAGLTYLPQIKANIQYSKSPFLPLNPIVQKIEISIRQVLEAGPAKAAEELQRISTLSLAPEITQHPTFAALKGRLLLRCMPARLGDAREILGIAIKNGSNDIMGPRDWYWGEVNSGYGLQSAINVCNLVLDAKQFTPLQKGEFLGKRGEVYNRIANSEISIDPEKAIDARIQAIMSFLKAKKIFRLQAISMGKIVDRVETSLNQTLDAFFRNLEAFIQSTREDLARREIEFLLSGEHEKGLMFDELVPWAINTIRRLANSTHRETARIRKAYISRLHGAFNEKSGLPLSDRKSRDELEKCVRECLRLVG